MFVQRNSEMTLFEQGGVVAVCVTNHVGNDTKNEVAVTQVVLLFVV